MDLEWLLHNPQYRDTSPAMRQPWLQDKLEASDANGADAMTHSIDENQRGVLGDLMKAVPHSDGKGKSPYTKEGLMDFYKWLLGQHLDSVLGSTLSGQDYFKDKFNLQQRGQYLQPGQQMDYHPLMGPGLGQMM